MVEASEFLVTRAGRGEQLLCTDRKLSFGRTSELRETSKQQQPSTEEMEAASRKREDGKLVQLQFRAEAQCHA